MAKLSVLLSEIEEARFEAYCRDKGHKKSTLIARLIREHLDREGYAPQAALPFAETRSPTRGISDVGGLSPRKRTAAAKRKPRRRTKQP